MLRILNTTVGIKSNSVSARELHKRLEIKTDFTNWIKFQIKRGALEEGIDFIVVWVNKTNRIDSTPFLSESELLQKFDSINQAVNFGYQTDYLLTLIAATNIVRVITYNRNSARVYEFLKEQEEVETVLVSRARKEIEFFEQLKETLGAMHICVETQSTILNYRVDGFIREANLVIEFDEPYHNGGMQQCKDKNRMNRILKYTHGEFIRLDSKDSNCANIGKVIQKIWSARVNNFIEYQHQYK